MALQTTVRKPQAFGVEGEFYDTSIRRPVNYKLATECTFGKPVWFDANGNVTATYASGLAFAGFLVNPKEHTNYGVSGDTLAPSFTLAAGKVGAVANFGRVIARVATNVAVGQSVWVCITAGTSTTTGVTNYAVGDLGAGATAPSANAGAGGAWVQVPGAIWDVVPNTLPTEDDNDITKYPLAVVRVG